MMQDDNNQPLPPELDWNKMKDGIFDKMASLEEKKSSDRKRRYPWVRFSLFLLLLSALTYGLYSIYQGKLHDQENAITKADPLSNFDLKNTSSSTVNEEASTNLTEYSDELLIEESGTTQKSGSPNFKGTDTQKNQNLSIVDFDQASVDGQIDFQPEVNDFDSFDDPSLLSNTPKNNNQVLKKQRINQSESPFDDSKGNNLGLTENTTNASENTLPSFGKADYFNDEILAEVTQKLPRITFGNVTRDSIYALILSNQEIGHFDPPWSANNISYDQLIVEGGLTFWNTGEKNGLSDRARYETPLISYQLQGHFVKNFKRNFFIMAGLQYQQLESKFSYDNIIPDYKILIRDTIVQVQNNPLTGEQNIIYGDVEQTVSAVRRVRHYNRTQLFKISLGAGKSWQFNSFQFDVYLGGTLNSLVQNRGRMLFNNAVIDYDGPSNPLFQNQMTIDGFLGARLHYFLTKEIGITVGFQTQKSLSNWSNQENTNFFPATFGSQLGLSYTLK